MALLVFLSSIIQMNAMMTVFVRDSATNVPVQAVEVSAEFTVGDLCRAFAKSINDTTGYYWIKHDGNLLMDRKMQLADSGIGAECSVEAVAEDIDHSGIQQMIDQKYRYSVSGGRLHLISLLRTRSLDEKWFLRVITFPLNPNDEAVGVYKDIGDEGVPRYRVKNQDEFRGMGYFLRRVEIIDLGVSCGIIWKMMESVCA